MAQSIKFGNDTYLDASSIAGIKDTLTSGDLNDYYGTHKSGMYYLGAADSAFSNAPAGWAALIVCSVEGASFQLVYRYNGIWIRSRTGSPATWQDWRKIGAIQSDAEWTYSGTISTASIPSGTATAVSSISLPWGLYVISGYIQYPSSTGGSYRNASIRNGSTSGTILSVSQVPPCSGATTRCAVTATVSLSSDSTIFLMADHNAGTDLTISGRFTAARIV